MMGFFTMHNTHSGHAELDDVTTAHSGHAESDFLIASGLQTIQFLFNYFTRGENFASMPNKFETNRTTFR
jgi:hypothetical protein